MLFRNFRQFPGIHCVAVCAFIFISLTACGFQMRGSQSHTVAKISQLNLRSVSADTLTREVRSQLQTDGVAVSSAADYTLTLANENYKRSILSISPKTGKAEEFQLTLSARVSISKKGMKDLVSNESITASRDYLFDEDALLGKASEERVLKENLRRQLAAAVIRRLNATVNNQQANGSGN